MAAISSEPPLPVVLRPNLLPSVDMSSLTQSELHSLSLLSNHSSTIIDNSNHTPFSFNLNPSLFNQSSSTCDQAFSDFHHRRRRRRGFSLLRRERSESNLIVGFLKTYLQLGDNGSVKKRRKKRNVKGKKIGDEDEKNVSVEIVNRNGEVVDLAALKQERENEGGPFGSELRKRAAGKEREEELLEMLAAMDGKWCSRRRKRRVVQACLLGDALPVGWKLIIALRRKAGKFSPYCHRYISPTGEELASCKEVASYLQSYFGIDDTSLLRDRDTEEHQEIVDSDQPMNLNSEEGNCMLDFPNSTTISNACVPIEPEKDVCVKGIDNLPGVRVSDLYECHTCNVSFDVKDKYLQHLMSSHQKTTRKYRLGSSVGAGVIIRDGKFECQFCHKVFEERRRYLGHVGNHVRGTARRSGVSLVGVMNGARSPCKEQMPTNTGISRMDALVEIVSGSIQDLSPSNVSNVDEVSLVENSAAMDADIKTEKSSSSCLDENGSREGKSSPENLNSQDGLSEICNACAVETEMEKSNRGGNASLDELNPPCDIVSEKISITDRDIVNDSSACHNEIEMGEGDDKHRCSSEGLIPQDKVREVSTHDGNMTFSSACPNELGIEGDKTLPEELNPCDKGGVEERNEQSFIFDTTIVPTETGLCAGNTSAAVELECMTDEGNRSANEPEGLLGIHFLLYNEKPLAENGAGEMIDSNGATERELEHAQEYNAKELATDYASSPFDEIIGKERRDMSSLDQNLGSAITPEYMNLDEADTQMYNGMRGEDFVSFSAISMGFEIDAQGGLELDASVGSQPEFPIDVAHESVNTTVCVWCGGEFCHKVIEIELQPDTVGFMCPTCRNKISKQFNGLESNFSVDNHYG